jgi:hypothetical protein
MHKTKTKTKKTQIQMETIAAVTHLLNANLHFRVQVTLEQATNILTKFQPYNGIPNTIEKLPQEIAAAIGPIDFGRENPNNGLFDNVEISIGNEFSLVLYVKSNTFYRKGDTAERQKLVLEGIARNYRADEVHVTIEPAYGGAHLVKARLWWD